ncbi:PD-(D/E)XK motif protein [Leifsonia sp. Root112D2]|uniref:PD-(D/E)XK motif protein n=1 Tax=Leifsonia sp. Root112D2 TaxID=1736426 RepID=UPI0006FE4192|nr:PD-(D/E)XK motif protein [Leifsonia sp. Root112D2]KQV06556.1 hypothetical protein ASC63_03775 [Leifsonia sp. Root112D2]
MAEIENPQHLDPAAVEDYFRLGVRAAFTMNEEPPVRLTIDPGRDQLQVLTPVRGSEPEVTAYERLELNRVTPDGDSTEWYELVVDASDMHYEAYVLLESVVDQLRSGASFRHAVSESVETLKELLVGRKRLTEEKVAGLIGELLVLDRIIDHDGEDAAIAAWLGPLAEEHDFGLPGYDAEVKTTKSEARVHVIGSETQLEPVPGRDLYLISVQITRAGTAIASFTLPELVASISVKLRRTLRAFDAALDGIGWRDADADLYGTRFQLRSEPRAYLVDDGFPAITSSRLDEVVPQRPLVVGVSYRVDVTHLIHAAIPSPLDEFCEEPK